MKKKRTEIKQTHLLQIENFFIEAESLVKLLNSAEKYSTPILLQKLQVSMAAVFHLGLNLPRAGAPKRGPPNREPLMKESLTNGDALFKKISRFDTYKLIFDPTDLKSKTCHGMLTEDFSDIARDLSREIELYQTGDHDFQRWAVKHASDTMWSHTAWHLLGAMRCLLFVGSGSPPTKLWVDRFPKVVKKKLSLEEKKKRARIKKLIRKGVNKKSSQ